MLLFGGCNGPYQRFNDVYGSKDGGRTWNVQTTSAKWYTRCCHAAVELSNGTVLVLGGHDMVDAPSGPGGYRNDVWASDDLGATWRLVVEHAEWSPRDALAVVRLEDDSLLLLGGHDGASDASQWHADVWHSTDGGRSWKLKTNAAEFTPRSAHAVAVVDGVIYTMGGWSVNGLLNDVWKSSDQGSTWTSLGESPWEPRWWFSALSFNGAVYVVGGLDQNGNDLNDVWMLHDDDDTTDTETLYSIVPAANGKSSSAMETLLCLQGSREDVQAALSHLQNSSIAALYEMSTVTSTSCSQRGFNVISESDECFPSLSLYYIPSTLRIILAYRKRIGRIYTSIVASSTVFLCHHDFHLGLPNGTSTTCRRNVTEAPTVLLSEMSTPTKITSSVEVGSHVPDAGLLCNEGPLTGEYTIFDMVRTLQNGSLAPIQQREFVQNVSCASRGFEISQGKPDHCYPPAVLWYTETCLIYTKQSGSRLEQCFHMTTTTDHPVRTKNYDDMIVVLEVSQKFFTCRIATWMR